MKNNLWLLEFIWLLVVVFIIYIVVKLLWLWITTILETYCPKNMATHNFQYDNDVRYM